MTCDKCLQKDKEIETLLAQIHELKTSLSDAHGLLVAQKKNIARLHDSVSLHERFHEEVVRLNADLALAAAQKVKERE